MPSRRVVPPDAPPTPVEERGKRLGLTFTRGRKITSNSHLALEAAEFANEYSVDPWGFHKRMFKAYFEDLEDIGDLETLVRIGADAGVDAEGMREALTEGRYRQRVDEGIDWSRGIGVTAIPTFVFNERYGIVGAHEQEAFRQMMAKLGQESN
jgi:predicted DsbA family dithiol-disulfide isomerase